MKSLPSIGIVTPSYNQGKFIEATIKSVLSQNYPKLEYWVIDGGSTDNTLSILKKYRGKIHFISEKDRGQANAINKGLKKLKTDIVAYLNSDDVYLPKTLLRVGKIFDQNKKINWLTGDYQIIDENGKVIQSFISKYKSWLRRWPFLECLAIANFISQPSTFWRRSVIAKIGLFNQELNYCMDFDYWMRLIKVSAPVISKKPLSQFRIHSKSKGGSNFIRQFEEEHEVVGKYIKNPLILLMHKLHASGIVLAYRFIK